MKKVRAFPKLVQQEKRQEVRPPNTFIFCERTTGMSQFRAECNADLNSTVERTAALLAIQCLVRGQNPGDFEIMIPADRTFAGRLVTRAKELLEAGRAVAGPASLSPRQREILNSVLCNRANKEIASRLNITVRTVKFHISSLLSKFGVENRAELARRAAGFLRPMLLEEELPAPTRLSSGLRRSEFRPNVVEAPLQNPNKTRSVRFPGRVLTA